MPSVARYTLWTARPERSRLLLALDAPFPTDLENEQRLSAIVRDQFDFVWRSLRRLGVAARDSDDAAQEVFVVLARKLSSVEPRRERAFLFATALRVASTRRRNARRRPEDPTPSIDEELALGLDPEELNELKSARLLLDEVLESLPLDLRSVFILHVLEEATVAEIAETLGLPRGTVSFRLKRAKEAFEGAAKRIQAREAFRERKR